MFFTQPKMLSSWHITPALHSPNDSKLSVKGRSNTMAVQFTAWRWGKYANHMHSKYNTPSRKQTSEETGQVFYPFRFCPISVQSCAILNTFRKSLHTTTGQARMISVKFF